MSIPPISSSEYRPTDILFEGKESPSVKFYYDSAKKEWSAIVKREGKKDTIPQAVIQGIPAEGLSEQFISNAVCRVKQEGSSFRLELRDAKREIGKMELVDTSLI